MDRTKNFQRKEKGETMLGQCKRVQAMNLCSAKSGFFFFSPFFFLLAFVKLWAFRLLDQFFFFYTGHLETLGSSASWTSSGWGTRWDSAGMQKVGIYLRGAGCLKRAMLYASKLQLNSRVTGCIWPNRDRQSIISKGMKGKPKKRSISYLPKWHGRSRLLFGHGFEKSHQWKFCWRRAGGRI